MLATLLATFAALGPPEPEPDPSLQTAFARLSPEARTLIVDTTLGKYDDAPPPFIAESVREEIRAWANSTE